MSNGAKADATLMSNFSQVGPRTGDAAEAVQTAEAARTDEATHTVPIESTAGSAHTHQTAPTSPPAPTPRATLDAWRARGVDRFDPLRFDFIDTLERRAAAHTGATRRVLVERLSALLDAYARDVERATATAHHASSANEPERGALAELVGYMHSEARHHEGGHARYPELPALDYFRQTWAKVRTEKQLRQSLQPAPGNAGPLNSSSLVHRSLSLMRELSPGYLKQFLSYVDALSWIEQLNAGAPPSKDAPRAGAAGKGARGKTR